MSETRCSALNFSFTIRSNAIEGRKKSTWEGNEFNRWSEADRRDRNNEVEQ